MALIENPTLVDIIDETDRLNGMILGKITPNVGEYIAGHYMTGNITVGNYSGTGGNCTYFQIPNKHYIKDTHWIMSSTPDLQSQNIVTGKSILGIVGSYSGKKWSSGTVVGTNEQKSYLSIFGGVYYCRTAYITLPFEASIVVCVADDPNGSRYQTTFNFKDGRFGVTASLSIHYQDNSATGQVVMHRNDRPLYANGDKKQLIVPMYANGLTVNWIAYE